MSIRRVVFDFDGTCTEIPAIVEPYTNAFFAAFAAQVHALTRADWDQAMDKIRRASPNVGWTLGTAPAAPAAADPFILADETAALLAKGFGIRRQQLPDLHTPAYDGAQAKWRSDVATVLQQLVKLSIETWFISNSRTTLIEQRLDDLLRSIPDVRQAVRVSGGAGKFLIQELPVGSTLSMARCNAFESLPAADTVAALRRPVYLRRGAYFDALCRALGDGGTFAETLVCGDVWELDLAMPAKLGCAVHLIGRQPPFDTYAYERDAVNALGSQGGFGLELSSVVERLGAK